MHGISMEGQSASTRMGSMLQNQARGARAFWKNSPTQIPA